MRTMIAPISTSSVVAIAVLLASPVARAQTSKIESSSVPDANAGEIIVTANKRGGQSLLTIPQSIQALTGDSLAKAGNQQFVDIAPKIPGLQIQDLGPGDKKYVIRGLNSVGDSTTGVYYDEAVISGSNGDDGGGFEPDIRLYDLDRVEVLRGPQGTLYGASSESGTIRFITKKPNLTKVEGYVTGEGSYTEHGGGNYHFNGAINLPIIDDHLGVRVVGWTDNDSGYIDMPRLPAGPLRGINNENTSGVRIHLRWQPSALVDLLATFTEQTTSSNGSSRYTPPGVTSFGVVGDPVLHPVPGGDLINTDVARSPYNEHLEVYSLTGNFAILSGYVTATVNQFYRRQDFNFDSTPILVHFGVPVPAETLEPRNRSVTSSELRYASKFSGPLNFVVGGFYQHTEANLVVDVLATNSLGLPIGPFSPDDAADALAHPGTGSTFFGRTDHRENNEYAGFGEATFNLTSKLIILGGIRYYSEDVKGLQVQTHPFGGFPGAPNFVPVPENGNFSKVTYKGNISYKLSPALLPYFTVSSGFRSGGVNAKSEPFEPIPNNFGPDVVTNYEVGTKGRILGNALTYSLDAYLIEWDNIQVGVTTADGAFNYVANAGSAEVKGFEFEFAARPFRYLTATASGSYQDAKLTAGVLQAPGPVNPSLGVKGDHIQNVPAFQAYLGVDYTRPLSDELQGTAALDVIYRDPTDNRLHASGDPFNVHLAAYTLLNLRLGLTYEKWNATFFVRNLTDERAQIDAISSTQDPEALLTVRPRTTGVTVTRTF